MKLLLYCTKAKPYLVERLPFNEKKFYQCRKKNDYYSLNGKIVAECDFEVEDITKQCVDVCKYCYRTKTLDEYDLMYKTQLNGYAMRDYLKSKNGYAIHIKNLHIFDEPKKLEECHNDDFSSVVNYAPQNMMYSWLFTDKWNRYILISIKPQWLCKILNGEKTIEVRKKVLRGMLK